MPELLEQMYCSQQIVIPPKFPYILKRYCKAAIKTQPYDLLRWSFEYFKALAKRRPPPVKLRLEYPVFSTEGGLTRGCLKVLANQLLGMTELPLDEAKAAWYGFCLDPFELRRIFCLCEVHMRAETVPFLHFIAVAGGLLTKNLTHTMILLCEALTKEPEGGSAAIPVQDFLTMYRFLARMDASRNVRYLNGYREGMEPQPEPEPEVTEEETPTVTEQTQSVDDFWAEKKADLHKLDVTDDSVSKAPTLSTKITNDLIGRISRSPSLERAAEIERQNYLKHRIGKPQQDTDVEAKLRAISASKMSSDKIKDDGDMPSDGQGNDVEIYVYDEEDQPVTYEIYGEPKEEEEEEEHEHEHEDKHENEDEDKPKQDDNAQNIDVEKYLSKINNEREFRIEDMFSTFEELAILVDRFETANYDLGMVAGRQMSTTSAEFIVQYIEKEILDYIDEQIGVLPDPDLKKKKAKPEEVAMIRELLETFIDENMDIICPYVEEEEEEEEPIPDIIVVYAVPGIGPPVDELIIQDFEEYAREVCKAQAQVFMPRNIRHFLCPPLEKYVEINYDEDLTKKETEIPTNGPLTET